MTSRADLLKLLSTEGYVSGEKIARGLSISRAAVHKQVQKLRGLGYAIESKRNGGYRLTARPDIVGPEELHPHLAPGCLFAGNIIYHPETTSTQIELKDRALAGAPEGTVVICDRQTSGYGRLRRNWSSPPGGLWFSLLLRPPFPPEQVPRITLAVSLSVCRALETTLKLTPRIKWPNDVFIGTRKCAGIITEMSAEVGHTNWVAVGIGLNVNNRLPVSLARSAVSLKEACGARIDRAMLCGEILNDLTRTYATLCCDGFAALKKEYNGRSLLAGRTIRVDTGFETLTGIFEHIDDDGYAWFKKTDGSIERIAAGDVSILKSQI